MIFLADESVDQQIIDRLREHGYVVIAVVEMKPGISDTVVLDLANAREALLVTADKDFGELVFRNSFAVITPGSLRIRKMLTKNPNQKT